jgi:protein-L-isoaspartate(D-aspartate) O-methyltransferase
MMATPADQHRALRERLVEQLRRGGALRSEAVAEALRSVPRHVFVPDVEPALVYTNAACVARTRSDGLPVSSSSQPAIVAIMLQQLGVEPGHRVLEIGAGTGYNAALLAHLAGETGRVTTVDLDPEIVAAARQHLALAGFDRVAVGCGDGGLGWPAGAPYDRIVLTVGAWDVAPAWIDQLAPTGRLVLPLSIRGWVQYSIALRRAGDHLECVSISPCGFMRLEGVLAGPEAVLPVPGEPGVFVGLGDRRPIDLEALRAALRQPGADVPSGVRMAPDRISDDGLDLWLALREPDVVRLMAIGRAAGRGLVPSLVATPGLATTDALIGADGRAGAALVLAGGAGGDIAWWSRCAPGTPTAAPAPPACGSRSTPERPETFRARRSSSTSGTRGWCSGGGGDPRSPFRRTHSTPEARPDRCTVRSMSRDRLHRDLGRARRRGGPTVFDEVSERLSYRTQGCAAVMSVTDGSREVALHGPACPSGVS